MAHQFTTDELQLIATGLVTYADILNARQQLADAIAAESEERNDVRIYDQTHCPVCGAGINDPDHCR